MISIIFTFQSPFTVLQHMCIPLWTVLFLLYYFFCSFFICAYTHSYHLLARYDLFCYLFYWRVLIFVRAISFFLNFFFIFCCFFIFDFITSFFGHFFFLLVCAVQLTEVMDVCYAFFVDVPVNQAILKFHVQPLVHRLVLIHGA